MFKCYLLNKKKEMSKVQHMENMWADRRQHNYFNFYEEIKNKKLDVKREL